MEIFELMARALVIETPTSLHAMVMSVRPEELFNTVLIYYLLSMHFSDSFMKMNQSSSHDHEIRLQERAVLYVLVSYASPSRMNESNQSSAIHHSSF